jgi:hypothetical protein
MTFFGRRRGGRTAACAAAADPVGLILDHRLRGATNGMGLGKPIDTAGIAAPPGWRAALRRAGVRPRPSLIAPVAIILVAENLGHVKAVGAMTGRNLDPYIGRAFLGDGIATIVSGSAGGTGVTTYAENIGVWRPPDH